jgi:uncharacterized protein
MDRPQQAGTPAPSDAEPDAVVSHDAAIASCGIAVMAKASVPGRAKTRLVPPLTFEDAAALNTTFLQDVTENMLIAARRAPPEVRIAAYAAYGPAGSEEFFRSRLDAAIELIPAWQQNFGDCLLHAIGEMLRRGHSAAVVLNADSPNLPTDLLNQTAALLARPGDRAVLGPSSDGGYYLLGLKAAHRHMFADIAWSTEKVAAQTRERAREVGLELYTLPTWYDIDGIEDLRRLHADIVGSRWREGPDAQRPHHASHTVSLLNRLWPNRDGRGRVESADRAAAAQA